jgi:RNA polymerase sigma-54 factor
LDYGLYTQLKTKQVLTPQQIQFLEVLQLPLPELISKINDYLTENPFLEQEDRQEIDKDTDALNSENDKIIVGLLENDRIHAHEDYGINQNDGSEDEQNEFGSCLNYEGLHDYLNMQLRLLRQTKNISQIEYNLAEYLIGNIDENGYLCGTVEEHSIVLKESAALVSKALEIIQSMDPPGVGARDLEECLSLQLKLLPDCSPIMTQFIKLLQSLAAGHLQKLVLL